LCGRPPPSSATKGVLSAMPATLRYLLAAGISHPPRLSPCVCLTSSVFVYSPRPGSCGNAPPSLKHTFPAFASERLFSSLYFPESPFSTESWTLLLSFPSSCGHLFLFKFFFSDLVLLVFSCAVFLIALFCPPLLPESTSLFAYPITPRRFSPSAVCQDLWPSEFRFFRVCPSAALSE